MNTFLSRTALIATSAGNALLLWLGLAWITPAWRTSDLASDIRSAGGQCECHSFLPGKSLAYLPELPLRWLNQAATMRIDRVTLDGNACNASLVERLARRNDVRSLTLSNSTIRMAELVPLRNLTSLRNLEITGINLSDEESRILLGALREIEVLSISSDRFRGEYLNEICNENLRELRLSFCPLSGHCIRHLISCPRLETIYLEYTAIDDKDIACLAILPRLRRLELMGTYVSGSGFAGFNSLEYIGLSDCPVNAKGLRSLPPVESLDLVGSRVTDAALEAFRDPCRAKKLQQIDLSCTCVSELGVLQLLGCNSLVSLRCLHSLVSPHTESIIKKYRKHVKHDARNGVIELSPEQLE